MSDQSPVFESPSFDEPEENDLLEEELAERSEEEGNEAGGGMSRSVLEHIARSLVDEPEAVEVEMRPGRAGLALSLHVAPDDMGRVIGKRGRIAQALRTVVRAAAAREGTEASVDIVD